MESATAARWDHGAPLRFWLIPGTVAISWIAAFALAPEFGPIAYTLPFAIPAISIAAFALYRAPSRQSLTTALLLFMVLFVLNLNFRQRELGETGLDLQNGTKFLVWLAILGLGALRWREIRHAFQQPLMALSLVYGAIALLSALWSDVPAYSAANAIGVLAYLILACFLVEDFDERQVLRIMVWTLAAYVGLGLIAGVLNFDVAWLAPSAEETTYRLQGFSGHPNTFGQQAAIAITLTAIAYRLHVIGRLATAGLVILSLAAILASGSRTNLAAALLAWFLIAVRSSPWRYWIFLGAMSALALLLLIGATGGLNDIDGVLRGLSRTGSEGEIFTLTGRTELWATCWKLITERPLLGWGYNGIEDILAGSMSTGFEGTPVNAHNMLVQTLVTMGFLGSLPAIAAVLWLCIKFVTQPDPARDQVLILLLIIGIGEVGIAATPILLTVVVFYFVARDGVNHSQFQSEPSRALS